MTKHAAPVEVTLPEDGIRVVESIHEPTFMMRLRTDAFDKLFLVGRGSIEIASSSANRLRATEGSAVFVPRGLEHKIEDIEASTLFLLCFSDALGQGFDEWKSIRVELGDAVRMWSDPPLESTLLTLWRRLLAEQERSDLGSRALLKAESLKLLVRLARSDDSSTVRQTSRISELVSELERTSFEPWTIDRAASWAGVSRRQFTKTFRSATGRTSVEHLTGVRLQRAKELLRSGGYTIAGAAYTCGFGDLAHFYRTFKHYEGKTPLQWADAANGSK